MTTTPTFEHFYWLYAGNIEEEVVDECHFYYISGYGVLGKHFYVGKCTALYADPTLRARLLEDYSGPNAAVELPTTAYVFKPFSDQGSLFEIRYAIHFNRLPITPLNNRLPSKIAMVR